MTIPRGSDKKKVNLISENFKRKREREREKERERERKRKKK